jgi:Family of unknown function (DUF6518)
MAGDVDDQQRRPWVIVAVALAGGLVLGPVDLLAQRSLPYPWANLANSSAVWAVGAFAIGVWARAGRWRPALAGTVLLLAAVGCYYLAATVVQHDNLSLLWSTTTLAWLVFGLLAGVVFGTGGGWSRTGNRWRRLVGVALPGAVLLAEAGLLVYRGARSSPAGRVEHVQTAVIEAALAVVCCLAAGRTRRERVEGLAASVPLALVGLGGFVLAGFGG